jgi:hypothetical protein
MQNQQPQQQPHQQHQQNDAPVKTSEAFSQLDNTSIADYYKQYKMNVQNQGQNQNHSQIQSNEFQGSYVAPQSSTDTNSELLKKLDNILYLLEEQENEKTNLITEELILYVFLGVFVIYVLDSFVKVGKYTR